MVSHAKLTKRYFSSGTLHKSPKTVNKIVAERIGALESMTEFLCSVRTSDSRQVSICIRSTLN